MDLKEDTESSLACTWLLHGELLESMEWDSHRNKKK